MLDLGPIDEFIQSARSTLRGIESEEFMADLSRAATEYAVAEFAIIADQIAEQNPHAFHHVYEWGEIGDPYGRLFRFIWGGVGNNTTLGFDFTESYEQVPERHGSGGRGEAVFHWKAAVLEDGGKRHIRVGSLGFLAWFDPEEQEWHYSREDQVVDNAVETQGQFSQLWATYWNTSAESVIAADFIRPYEMRYKRTQEKIFRAISQGRAVPRGGWKVNIVGRKNHDPHVRAELRNHNNIFSALAQARGRAANVGRFGGL